MLQLLRADAPRCCAMQLSWQPRASPAFFFPLLTGTKSPQHVGVSPTETGERGSSEGPRWQGDGSAQKTAAAEGSPAALLCLGLRALCFQQKKKINKEALKCAFATPLSPSWCHAYGFTSATQHPWAGLSDADHPLPRSPSTASSSDGPQRFYLARLGDYYCFYMFFQGRSTQWHRQGLLWQSRQGAQLPKWHRRAGELCRSGAGSRPSALLPEEGAVRTAIAPTGLENGKKKTFRAACYTSGAFGAGARLETGALSCYSTVDKE